MLLHGPCYLSATGVRAAFCVALPLRGCLHCMAKRGIYLHFRAHHLVLCLNVNSLVRMMCGWIYFALMPLGVTSRVRTGQDKLHEGKILLLYLILVHSVTLHITKGKK